MPPPPVKDVGPERVVAVPLPKAAEKVVVALAVGARVSAVARLQVTEPREVVLPIAFAGAVTGPRLLGRADGAGARVGDAEAPPRAEVVADETAAVHAHGVPEVILAVPCALVETVQAVLADAEATEETIHAGPSQARILPLPFRLEAAQMPGARVTAPDPSRVRPALPRAGHIGDERPPRRLPEVEHVVVEVEQIGGLAEGVTLGVPPVLAGAHDGPWRVPIAIGAHKTPTDALTDVPLVTMDAAPVVHAPGPEQRL